MPIVVDICPAVPCPLVPGFSWERFLAALWSLVRACCAFLPSLTPSVASVGYLWRLVGILSLTPPLVPVSSLWPYGRLHDMRVFCFVWWPHMDPFWTPLARLSQIPFQRSDNVRFGCPPLPETRGAEFSADFASSP